MAKGKALAVCRFGRRQDRVVGKLSRCLREAQNNNHAVSEAAALFIGGIWLRSLFAKGEGNRSSEKWARVGRASLERLVDRLVFKDGGFSQYSTNYHRLMLDTLSQVECWRIWLDAAPF